ncbi:MAG TPA: ankyrin repeat domain-containing protein [Methylophilaceae bacterium]|nr:ankyrin repeat domain-containing protein [Methylophilaceae bacterium]
MKIIKALIVAIAFYLPIAAFALDGSEQVEYTDALSTGKIKVVQKYLKNGVDVNEKYFAWSALQIAANKGQLAVVKLLVEKGAEIDYKHPITKMTALHLAAYDGYEDVVKYLLSKGADPNLKMRGNVSIVRAVRDNGNTKMLEILEAGGAKDDGCQEEKCN